MTSDARTIAANFFHRYIKFIPEDRKSQFEVDFQAMIYAVKRQQEEQTTRFPRGEGG